MTVHTVVLFCDFREIITLEIEGLGHPEHIARAIFDAEFAALAPFFDHRYPTPGDLDGLQIKWKSPIFHSEIPLVLRVETSFLDPRLGKKTRVIIHNRDRLKSHPSNV